MCVLLGLTEPALETSSTVGNLFETLVYAEFRKHIKNQSSVSSVWFYRDQQGREIDFLYLHQGQLHFYECKWTEVPSSQDARSMNTIYEEIKQKHDPSIQVGTKNIVCRTPHAFPLGDETKAVPVQELFLDDLAACQIITR